MITAKEAREISLREKWTTEHDDVMNKIMNDIKDAAESSLFRIEVYTRLSHLIVHTISGLGYKINELNISDDTPPLIIISW